MEAMEAMEIDSDSWDEDFAAEAEAMVAEAEAVLSVVDREKEIVELKLKYNKLMNIKNKKDFHELKLKNLTRIAEIPRMIKIEAQKVLALEVGSKEAKSVKLKEKIAISKSNIRKVKKNLFSSSTNEPESELDKVELDYYLNQVKLQYQKMLEIKVEIDALERKKNHLVRISEIQMTIKKETTELLQSEVERKEADYKLLFGRVADIKSSISKVKNW